MTVVASDSEEDSAKGSNVKKLKKALSEEELVQRSCALALTALQKMRDYWAMTSYADKGSKIEASDVKTEIIDDHIQVKGRCMICKQFKAFALHNNRSLSMANYAKHAARHFVKTADEVELKTECVKKEQRLVTSFFKASSGSSSTKEVPINIEEVDVQSEQESEVLPDLTNVSEN